MKIQIPKKNCINCADFAWWDGDFCCVGHTKILQESPDGKFNKNILMSLRLNKNCKDYKINDNKVQLIYQKKFDEFLKENNYEIQES